MEILYFPLFLIVVAVGVIWLFKRATNGGARSRKSASQPASQLVGRLADLERRPESRARLGAAARLQSGQRSSPGGDIWQTKRERAARESFNQTSSRGIYHAGYIAPDSQPGSGLNLRGSGVAELRDQQVSEAEHKSIDEYLTKSEREAAERKAAEREAAEREAEKAGGLSMSAMKYDPAADAESGAEEAQKRKGSAGFKP